MPEWRFSKEEERQQAIQEICSYAPSLDKKKINVTARMRTISDECLIAISTAWSMTLDLAMAERHSMKGENFFFSK